MRLRGKEATMTNKQKRSRISHLFRKRKSIWHALLEKDEATWELCYQLSWDGMAKRHKQQINNQ